MTATLDRSRPDILRRDEAAARAAVVRVDTIEVDLDLRAAREDAADTFPTQATLVFACDADATWIDFAGASVDSVIVDGAPREVRWDGARVHLDGLGGRHEVTIRGRGRFSTSGEGLHRFRDPVDDQVYLYTQYEPADCRRVYPCFEQPDLKARWRMHVSAPSDWIVLSGGAEEHRETVPGGIRVTFAPTLPLSSYITAVAAGPYHRVDGVWEDGGRRIDLGVLCRASLAEHLDADEILDVTRRGLTLFTDAFGCDYPWGKYDQIFVPEYNLGAMENPGLVTFTEAYVFRGAATAAQREGRANTILHEMAHMWFGDLTTMGWWDDLWLKESFADFMGAFACVATGAHPDAWVTFATRRKGWAYEQDQLPTTHPIVADIVDLEAAKLNFDGITYAKGASVLKQLVAFVGQDAFFRGAQRYFTDHAFGSTTLSDLLTALEAASGRDLRAWSEAWLLTTGVNTLRVERDGAEAALVQSDPRPDRVAIGCYADDGGRLRRVARLETDLTGARTSLPEALPESATLVVPNDDDRTYAKVRLDPDSTETALARLSDIDDALTRSVVWSSLWNAARDGELAAARYLEAIARHAPREASPALLADALARAEFTLDHYVRAENRADRAAWWLDTAWDALHAAEAGSDAQLTWARAVAAAAARCDARAGALRELLAGDGVPAGLPLDPDLRWRMLVALATTGHADAGAADVELARDPSAASRRAYETAVAARPDAAVRAAAWRAAWQDRTLTNEQLDATIAGIRAGGRRDLIAAFDDEYFAQLREVWASRSIEIARRLVSGLFPASDSLAPADAWLAANADAPAALVRIVVERRDGLARDVRVRAAQPAV